MNLSFDTSIAESYNSNSQRARVLTESWFGQNMYCPICGAPSLVHTKANKPVEDFYCEKCNAEFELKSRKKKTPGISNTISGGEYNTMRRRLNDLDRPHFIFLNYFDNKVKEVVLIPNFFFTESIIQERPALPEGSKRAGWQGCNILLKTIPEECRIPLIVNSQETNHDEVMKAYHKLESLRKDTIGKRRWLFDVMQCVNKLPVEFTLDDIYKFTDELQVKHPKNYHVQDKIRQQLQFLRDKEYLEFISRGTCRRIGRTSLL